MWRSPGGVRSVSWEVKTEPELGRIQVAHVITRWSGGSAINVTRWIAEERRAGRLVHLVVGSEDLTVDPPVGCDVAVCRWLKRSPSPFDDALALVWLLRFLRRTDVSIIHTHQAKAGVLGRVAGYVCGVPLVVHTVHLPSFDRRRRSHVLLRWLERLVSKWTECMYFVGDEMLREHVAAGIGGRARNAVIRSPVDLDRFAASSDTRTANRHRIRTDLEIPSDATVIVTAGRLEPRKRHRELIAALDARGANAVLLVAGDGVLMPSLETAAGRTATLRVELLGHRSDLDAVFHASDVYVHASALEGVPQVIVQAVAAGLRALAVDSGGVREVPDVEVVDGVAALASGALGPATERSGLGREHLPSLGAWSPSSVQASIEATLSAEGSMLSQLPRRLTISGWVPEHTGLGVLRQQVIAGLEDRCVEVDELRPRVARANRKAARGRALLRGLSAAPGWRTPHLHVVPPLPLLAGPRTVSILADARWRRTRGRVGRWYRQLDLMHCAVMSRRLAAISSTSASQFRGLVRPSRQVAVTRLGGDHLRVLSRPAGSGGRLVLIGAAAHKRNEVVLEALCNMAPSWLKGIDLVSVSPDAVRIASHLPGVDVREYRHVSRDELAGIYARADVYIGISEEEGFGLPWVEALRAGCAVIAVDCPIAREVVGESATFIPPSLDSGALARELGELKYEDIMRGPQGDVRLWSHCVDDIVSLLTR